FGANLQQRGVVPDFFVTPYEKPTDEFASSSAPTGPTSPPKAKPPARPAPETASNGSGAGDLRPARQTKPETAPLNNARDAAPAHAPASASNPATVERTTPNGGVAADTAPPTTANSPIRSTPPTTANNPGLSASVGEATASAPPSGFLRFRDAKIGYSFD